MSTYTRFLLFVLAIFLLHSALPDSGAVWAQGEVITFSVTGDVPYGGSEVSEFQAIIDNHNLYSPSDFIVHVGDIKSGGGSCGETHYTQMRDMLLSSAVPAYIVIGDNEWSDCSDQDQAWTYWMTHLFEIESNFCATPPVERHPVRQELFAFVQKGVLFIGINLVGGGNDSAILQADAEWISQQMVAKKSQVRAAVVFAQAKGSGSFETDFAAASLAFGKPVLYIQGNKHGWSYSDPYLESNVTRVIIDRGNKPPVHVTVAMTGENPFTFERDPWPSGTSPFNHPPCAYAGPDTSILQTGSALLHGSASDDGIPLLPGNLSYTWRKLSGPGDVAFGDSTSLSTSAGFTAGGIYQLQLQANDGGLSGYDTVSVDVQSVGPSVSISDATVTEGNSGTVAAVFDVTMTNLDGFDVTVQYSTGDISTTADVDYVAQSGSVTLTNAVPSGSIAVVVNGDGDYEPDESFRVNLSAPSHGSILDGEGVGSIVNDDAPAAPAIASFTPSEGPGGTEVILTGANYVEISSVMFNGVAALSYSVDSATQIRATAPAGGSGLITVTNSGGSGNSSSPFTVLNIPNITGFTPSGGPAGIDVTIAGFHFNGTTEVSFNGVAGSIQSTSDSELIVTVPIGATTGKIRVTNSDGMGESASDFAVLPPPVVSSFSPSIGPPGTEVTVFGSNCAEASAVYFSGTSASSFTIDSESQVRAVVPAGASSGPITVENLAGGGTSASNFTVTAPPSLLTFSPVHDTYVRSDRAGNNYGGKSHIDIEEDAAQRRGYLKFDVTGVAGSVQSAKIRLLVTNAGNDGGGIYSVSNDHSTGGAWTEGSMIWGNAPVISGSALSSTGSVAVGDTVEFDVTGAIDGNGTYSFGIQNASTSQMEYSSKEGPFAARMMIDVLTTPLPVISSFIPASGAAGDAVTISGQNFGGTTLVSFNGAPASIGSNSGSELVVAVPSGATTGKIEVTNADGTGQSASDFTVILPPVVSGFSPTSGAAGTEVTITGSNLGVVSSVKFNGLSSATLDIDSESQLRAKVPSGASSGPIELANLAGSVQSTSSFTVAQIPVVSSFSPVSGVQGTTVVTINGSNFTPPSSIFFGNVQATSTTFVSENQCTAMVPAGASTGKIKVTNSDGTGESQSDFIVVVPPTITSFSPASGPPGTEVTIIGNNCAQATAVMFNNVAASSFNLDSDTQIRAMVPAGASSGKISVENVAGVGESASSFNVTAPPSTLSFSPIHDAHVRSDRASNNYGGSSNMDIEEDTAQRRAYLKFDVAGISGAVQSAVIRMLVTNAGKDGGGIYPVSNEYSTGGSWTEGSLLWDNAPLISGSPLSSTGSVSVGDIIEFDVTGAITGNGIFSFGIKNNSTSRMEYSSKEGSQAPELVLDVLTSPVPIISSFNPSEGVQDTEVTINGLNFATTSSVAINGTQVQTIVSQASSQLKVLVPAGATTGKISVTNADGTGHSAGDFAVILPPTLSGFSPSSGPAGTQVELNGSNLSHVTEVAFGSTQASDFNIDSDSVIRVTVPAGAPDAKIAVTSMAGSDETGSAFTVTLPPAASITSFTPAAGPIGTEVIVSGQNIIGITGVSFGDVAASAFEVDSDTQLRATVPSGATTGRIGVTNDSGTGESATDFEVTAPPSSLTFTPIADNRVKSTSPDKNYGSSSDLRVELEPTVQNNSYLKFEIIGIGAFVQSAKLRLHVISSSDDGGGIYSVSNNYAGTATPWEESGLTWNNAPEIAGVPLSSLGQVSSGSVVEFDVTTAIAGDGIYNFAISNSSTDAVKYTPKEGGIAPELVVETSSSVSKRSPWDDSAEDLAAAELAILPQEISLKPAYPNPFNLSTTIEYGLPEPGAVRLSVHNVRGQEVRLLVEGDVEGGFQRVIWNGRDNRGGVVGSGVYFVRLIRGRRVLTQVLTLQK